MARLNDEQYACVLMNQLRNDLAKSQTMSVRATVVSRMADEIELASNHLSVSDDSRRTMRELAREVRDELRRARKALLDPAPVEQTPAASPRHAIA